MPADRRGRSPAPQRGDRLPRVSRRPGAGRRRAGLAAGPGPLLGVSTAGPQRRVTRVAAYALCVEDDRLLMCRLAPGEWTLVGHWTLPGGGLAFGESPPDAALRELDEETGL